VRSSPEGRRWRLGFVGLGQLGRAVVNLLATKNVQLHERGFDFAVTTVATRHGGVCVDPLGLPLQDLLKPPRYQGSPPIVAKEDQITAVLADPSTPIDILIEVSPPNHESGEPAARYIRAALSADRHVVTANKGPIAWCGAELDREAQARRLSLRYEATLMGCLPAQVLRESVLPLARVTSFLALPNATTNYLLTEIGRGNDFDEALNGARNLGIVEADPSEDIDGWDSVLKATILHNLLFEGVPHITPNAVQRVGLSQVDSDWVRERAKAGGRVKGVARGTAGGTVSVGFEAFDASHLVASLPGSSMYLEVETDLAGRVCIALENPAVEQSAYAVVMDLLAVDHAAFMDVAPSSLMRLHPNVQVQA
jgi:homoserine dehydrogenase